MIFISKYNENIEKFKNAQKLFEVIVIYCNEKKSNLRAEVVNSVQANNYFLHKKKIYVFLDSYEINKKILDILFKSYFKIVDNKDIYLLNIGSNEYHLKNKYRNKYQIYKCIDPQDSKKETFFSDIRMVSLLAQNRRELINYENISPPMSYILDVISYNISRIVGLTEREYFDKNLDSLFNIRKIFNATRFGCDPEFLHALLDFSYQPLPLRDVMYPPKKREKIEKPTKKREKISIEQLRKKVKPEFMTALNDKPNVVRNKGSMF